MRKVELLSPAKDVQVGIEAFNHGADAVYIGSPRFSARAAAGNTVADIERLAAYGHRFGAHTIVALNTIMTDAELADAERLTWQLYEAGVDALIIQDLGLLELHLPPIELHSSTQMDNRTIEKVRLLKDLGMTRVVLARELSVAQIRAIHEAVDVELECFVHGALCVSVSGQCYLSAAMTGRSANRGECAQPCRLPMDLIDAEGKTLVRNKHLLSLKDMNRSGDLEAMIDAGVTSLKIEGRLKDMGYVKNVTAYYRRRLDALLEGHPDWYAASDGRCTYSFEPRVAASFNRGFTSYYIHGGRETESGRKDEIWSMDTPKSVGEKVGIIERIDKGAFTVRENTLTLNNGDGLVAKDDKGNILGFRLNKSEMESKRIYPAGGAAVTDQLRTGMTLYRNLDYRFDQLLQKPSATRKIGVKMRLQLQAERLLLSLTDERGVEATVERVQTFEPARTPQQENYKKQLAKLGDTNFELREWTLQTEAECDLFLPSSLLSELRREVCERLATARSLRYEAQRKTFKAPDYRARAATLTAVDILPETYLANVMNQKAADMLRTMHLEKVAKAFELSPVTNVPVMFTSHCVKYALGCCPKYQHPKTLLKEPLSLKIGDKKFVIKFGCKDACVSEILITFAHSNN